VSEADAHRRSGDLDVAAADRGAAVSLDDPHPEVRHEPPLQPQRRTLNAHPYG
jgi:hypothetical protein